MYYSIVVPGYLDAGKTSWGERAFIGLMESSDPSDNSSWKDKGFVITNASDRKLDFYVSPTSWESCYYRWNAIDPSYIITPEGEHWLIYGSWHSGIVAVGLDAATGKVKSALPKPWGDVNDIAAYGWVGISHCAVFDDGNDNWYFSSQGRFPQDAGGAAPNAVFLGHIRRIIWTSDEWPLVLPERYGAVPKVAITENDIIGTWEHIDLGYSYGKQKESVQMEFAANHTITSGPWKGGKWSYNASTQVLSANGVTLYLSRETDWEATPRTHTIVYAGLGDHKTYWGKKRR